MSLKDHSPKRFFTEKGIPFITLISGLILLYLGNQEYQSFQAEVDPFTSVSPNNQTIWMLILGSAATVAGIVGLLRRKVFSET